MDRLHTPSNLWENAINQKTSLSLLWVSIDQPYYLDHLSQYVYKEAALYIKIHETVNVFNWYKIVSFILQHVCIVILFIDIFELNLSITQQ